jgi:long-chain acyl-CoA synthetase
VAAQTIPRIILDRAKDMPDAVAYYEKVDGAWLPTMWREYGAQIAGAARALIALGIQPGNAVTVLGFNRPDWVILDVAAMAVGAVPAGIYTTNSPNEVHYVAAHSAAPLILIEDEHQWEKVAAIRDRLPELRHVVTMRGCSPIDDPMVLSWDEFVAKGADVDASAFDVRLAALKPNDLATLIYTSGTTGPPKGVMLSHENLVFTASEASGIFDLGPADSNVSYLPLSHIAEQMFTIHIPAMSGGHIFYAESIDLLADNLKETRPTIFAAVPRVWEKLYAGVQGKLREATGIKARLAKWAMGVGRRHVAALNRGEEPSASLKRQYGLADKLVLSKVRTALGLDRTQVFLTAAAPLNTEILEFFSGFGMIINEVYGQSEGSGPTSATIPGRTVFESVGIPFPKTEVRIGDDGEILVRGKHVFLGYYKDEEATREALRDGWLHSGDLGEFDAAGNLYITGRKKDIIVTAGGKNIAPKLLEGALKGHDLVSEAVVIGDRRKYLTALVTLDDEAAEEYMLEHGLDGDPHTHPEVHDSISATVTELNNDVSRVEQIKKFVILPRPLTIEDGELTPTLKVKRSVVAEHFADQIESMYSAD